MRDMFDDFLQELRRREAKARGEDPDAGAPRRARSVGPDSPDPDPDAGDDGRPGDPAERGDDGEREPGDDSEPPREPRPAPREASPPRRPRPVPDMNEGRGGGPRIGWWLAGGFALVLIVLFGVGLDLWTDVLWFQSVGFDAVFWTRLTAQVALFFGGTVLVLIVLLVNLRLAGRLMPPPEEGRGGSFRDLLSRLNDAAAQANQTGPGRRYAPETPRPVSIGADDIPDLTPIAGIALVVVSVLVALTVGGSVAAGWETVLLWINRVPFSPDTASAVTDPVFGRDISYFLFELPFLRFVQALFNGIVVAALIVAFARYLVGASRGSLVFSTSVRVHLAVLGALFSLAELSELGVTAAPPGS